MEVLKIFHTIGDLSKPHLKKNRIRASAQSSMATEIAKYTTPTYIHKRAAETMADGDFIPPFIPNKGKQIIIL